MQQSNQAAESGSQAHPGADGRESRLASRLSLLLIEALDCLATVEKEPRYLVDMDVWHRPEAGQAGRCRVSLAGAVMSCQLGADPEMACHSEDFGPADSRKLDAIEIASRGDTTQFLRAACWFYDRSVPSVIFQAPAEWAPMAESGLFDPSLFSELATADSESAVGFSFPAYDADPQTFKAGIRRVAEELDRHGL